MKYRKFIKVFDLNDGVVKSRRLTHAQILVYGYLHGWWESYQTGNRESYEKIAFQCDIARSTFANAILRLESLGWIEVLHGARITETKNECNIYSIKRMPDAHIKHTKKVTIRKNYAVLTKPKKTDAQKKLDKKYAILAIANDVLSYEDYQNLRRLLDI